MGVIIKDNTLVSIREPETIYFDLPKDAGNNLKHETAFIIKHNEFLAQLKNFHTIKNEIS